MNKKLLIWQNQWSPTYPFLLKKLMFELTELGIEFDYFVFNNDIRLNVSDKDVTSFYETLPLVTNVDVSKYFAILGEYERFNSAPVFRSFIDSGKRVINYDYSSMDAYSQMLEGGGKFPRPITDWLSTNESFASYVKANSGLSNFKSSKSVGNLYLENALTNQEDTTDHIVLLHTACGKLFDQQQDVRQLGSLDNIKRIEDQTQMEVRVRMHPSMYTVLYQSERSSSDYLTGAAGFNINRKIVSKTNEFYLHGFDKIYDKIIHPSKVLQETASARFAISMVPTTTVRELILNGKNYYCLQSKNKRVTNLMANDNRMLREKINTSSDFFPLIQDRFIDPNRDGWLEGLCQKAQSSFNPCESYNAHRKAILSESQSVSRSIANCIAGIANE